MATRPNSSMVRSMNFSGDKLEDHKDQTLKVLEAEMLKGFLDASSALLDVIQKNQLISKGPPKHHRLITTRSNLNEDGSVRKWTFGERDNETENKIILLVGETGTGKTTLINTMVNHLLGVKFGDEVWFHITEEDQDDQSESQTTQVTMYEVFVKGNPVSLTIIDSPGYGSTRGSQHDEDIAGKLYTLFYNDSAVKHIDAVALVLKASENRISDRFVYIFDSVMSLFGKNIQDNIVIFFTHSSGSTPRNAINAVKKAEIPCKIKTDGNPDYFLFNNCQLAARNPEDEEDLQRAWGKTEKSLECFFSTLNEVNRQSLQQTKDVLVQRIRLAACVTNLQERIEFVEKTQIFLNQIQNAIKENQDNIKRNKNFTFEVTEFYKELVEIKKDTPGYTYFSWLPFRRFNTKATTCTFCKETCHDENNCYLAFNPATCELMEDGKCTVCKYKCHHSKHVKESKKYETRGRTKQMTYENLKRLYETRGDEAEDFRFDSGAFKNVTKQLEDTTKNKEEKLDLWNKVQEDMNTAQLKKMKVVEDACSAIIRLCETALKPDSAFIINALDYWIPRAEENEKLNNLAQKLKELRKIDQESENRAYMALSYMKSGFHTFKNLF